MSRATTFDLYVLDVSTKWHKHQQDIADGKQPAVKMPTQEEMLEMIRRTREESENDKR